VVCLSEMSEETSYSVWCKYPQAWCEWYYW